MNPPLKPRLVVGIGTIALLAVAYWAMARSGILAMILDGQELRQWIMTLGFWGPLAVIGTMTVAILASPIPSAPIALAAGAAYGHTWGTVYVVLGAEAGAIAAFGIARLVGHDVLQRWFGDKLSVGLLGSQNVLTGIVFASRLLPFISFDLISYAAGLTILSFWRFAIATFAGIIPASFLLAHFGGEMATGETERILISALVLGGITLLPVVLKFARGRAGTRQFKRGQDC